MFKRISNNIFALGAALVTGCLLTLFCLLLAVHTYVLRPGPLVDVLERADVYRQVPQVVVEQLVPTASDNPVPVPGVSIDQWRTVLLHTLSSDWLQSTVVQLLTQLYRLQQPGVLLQDIDTTVSLVIPKRAFVAAFEQTIVTGHADIATETRVVPALVESAFPDTIQLVHLVNPQSIQQNNQLNFQYLAQPVSSQEQAQLRELHSQIATVQQGLQLFSWVLWGSGALSLLLLAAQFLVHVRRGVMVAVRWVSGVCVVPLLLLGGVGSVLRQHTGQIFDSITPATTWPARVQAIARGVFTLYVGGFARQLVLCAALLATVVVATVALSCIVAGKKSTKPKTKPAQRNSYGAA